MPYRPLTIPERDFLFALYDKHGSNMMAMSRDRDCIFKSHRQISFYCQFYAFQTKLAELRRRRAEEVVAELGNAKTAVIERAMEMMRPRQVPIKMKHPTTGEAIYLRDEDDNLLYDEIYPSQQEIKTAWEIIKAEMGEPTSVSKSDVTSGGKPLAANAIAFIDMNAKEDDTDSQQ